MKKIIIGLFILLFAFTLTSCVEGPLGLQGIQGEQGEPGHTPVITIQDGNWYIDGVDTGVSAVGPQGPQGETGPQGPQGEVGATGPQGETGATGPQGPAGETGATGATGATGPQGPAGETGATGPQGPQGEVGPQGPAGEAGQNGLSAYELFKKYVPEYTGSEEQFIIDLAQGKLASYFATAVDAHIVSSSVKLEDSLYYTSTLYSTGDNVINYNNPSKNYSDKQFACLEWGDSENPTRTIEAGVAFTMEFTASFVSFSEYSAIGFGLQRFTGNGIDLFLHATHMVRYKLNGGDYVTVNYKDESLCGEQIKDNGYKGQSPVYTFKLDVATDGSIKFYVNGNLEVEAPAGTFDGGEVGFYCYAVESAVISNYSLKIK